MPIIPRIPEAVPYAGQVSVHIDVQALRQFNAPDFDIANLQVTAEGVPSNAAPHILKKLGGIGISTEDATITYSREPNQDLRSVSRQELLTAAINPGMGRRMWSSFTDAIASNLHCNLTVESEGQIQGDFGFGLEWLRIHHGTVTANGLAHRILMRRALTLGVSYGPQTERRP